MSEALFALFLNLMRLDEQQKRALTIATADVSGEIFLFGSRTNDNKKGGDVDVLIFSKDEPFQLSQNVARIYEKECRERIDVVVIDPENLTDQQKAFLNVIEKVKFK